MQRRGEMIDLKINKKQLKLDIDLPGKQFWDAVTLDIARTIRKRTESGYDVNGKRFKPYNKEYLQYRREKGRSLKPNLTFTGRMLGSIRAQGYKRGGRVTLSGEEGYKAWINEKMGREFFDISQPQINEIADRVDKWIAKRNKAK